MHPWPGYNDMILKVTYKIDNAILFNLVLRKLLSLLFGEREMFM